MAAKALSRDELAFGRAFLLATDSIGLSPEGALWIYNDNERKWHYFLATSLFSKIGAREIYLRLNKALKAKLSETETKNFGFYISDPDEDLIEGIREVIKTDRHATAPQKVRVDIDGHTVDAWVYRMAVSGDIGSIKQAKRRFRQLSEEIVAA